MSVKGSGTLLFQSQPWSCGASVCFLDNRERKPPFRRPGRPQQPHTHTETHRLTGSRPHAGACVSRSRQHCPPPGGKEGGTTQRLPCKCSHAPAHLSDLFSVLHPAKKTHDLHFQRQNLGVCVGAIKGDIKGGFHFSHVLVAEDMDFHLIMVNCRDSRTKTFVSLACHLRIP